MSEKALTWALAQNISSASAKLVLVALALHADDIGCAQVEASYLTTKCCDRDPAKLDRALGELAKHCGIDVEWCDGILEYWFLI